MNILRLKASKNSTEVEFQFIIHRCEDLEDLSLSAKDFYKEHGKQDILFPHYEVEVINHEVLPQEAHCFMGKNNKGFICWPFQTSSESDAVKLARGWSAAVFITLQTGEDANSVLGKFCSTEKQLQHLENADEAIGVNIEMLT